MQPYKIIRSARRTLSVQVKAGGEVVVRAPRFVGAVEIEKFVNDQADWLTKALARVASRPQRPRRAFNDGEILPYLGWEIRLCYLPSARPRLHEGTLFFPERFRAAAKKFLENWYREAAREVLQGRLELHAARMGLKFSSLCINGAKTRWGSCGADGRVSLNWRMLLAPLAALDYVVIHELSHIRHQNHSPAFWSEVEKYCEDWREWRRWFKENAAMLEL